jgi:hypothetical protein
LNELEDANRIAQQTGQPLQFDTAELRDAEPSILPENEQILDTYFRVMECTHPSMTAVPGPPIWSDIREVLELHGEWTPWMQEQLGKIFRGIRSVLNEEAQEKPPEAIDLN